MHLRFHTVLLMLLAMLLIAGAEGDAPPDYDENSVGPDQAAIMQDVFMMCGDLVDSNDAQTFFGPAAVAYLGDYTNHVVIGTAATCDTYDAETEAGAANAALAADMPAFKVNGFFCVIQTFDITNDLTFTLRSAGANTTPVLSCTIDADAAIQGCGTATGTTTDIAAGGTVSMRADYNEDLDAVAAHCKVYITIK